MVNVDEAKAKLIEYRNFLVAELAKADEAYKQADAVMDAKLEQVKQSKHSALIAGVAVGAMALASGMLGYMLHAVIN